MISDPAALAAEISDAETPAQRLVEIAGSFPEFGPVVAEHPNASLDVLSYLLKHGDEQTRKAAARRRARDVAQITLDASRGVIAKPSGQSTPARASMTLPSGLTTKESEVGKREVPDAQAPEPSAPAPAPPERERPAPAPEPLAPEFRSAPTLSEDVDHTRLSQRAEVGGWFIVIDGHGETAVTATDILIGRKPSMLAEFAQSVLVKIPDPTKTVSKTHARMVHRDGTWFITDLSSTNGVFLETPRGEHRIVANAEIEVVGVFALGDLRVRIVPRA